MIYQRRIPEAELFAAQLEMMMQNGRVATLSSHLVGVAATVILFWPYVGPLTILLGCALFLIMLLARSLQMSNALVEHRYRSHTRRVFWQLIAGAACTGAVWSTLYIFAAERVPVTTLHVFLLVIVMITAFSVGVNVIIREYFLAYLFTSLWPIAWWNVAHYWEETHNLLIGLCLLAICALLVSLCDRIHQSYRNMISLNWERDAVSRELGELTGSLKDRNRQLQDARQQLTELANVDELTGLGNRRLVNKVLQEEINRARRGATELSIILLDVDYFKNYNDSYGHPAGDAVLKQLAQLMQRAASRAGEVVARYGGEEFILVLPGASASSALRTASRLRELVMEEQIPHRSSGVSDYLTISQGVATVIPDLELEPAVLIQAADAALYRSKDAGRNSITVAGQRRAREGEEESSLTAIP